MVNAELTFQNLAICSALLALSWLLLKLFVKHPFDNLPGPPSPSIFFGNTKQLRTPQGWAFYQTLAKSYGNVVKCRGYGNEAQLWVSDPKALHHMVVKEQDIYEETNAFIHSNKLIWGEGLFGTLGERQRKQRKILNPAFSPRHLQEIVPIFRNVSHKVLRDAILSKVEAGPQEIDMLHWFGRTALELVGQSGLGYSFDNLDDGPPHPYSLSVKSLFPALFCLQFLLLLIPYVADLGPPSLCRAFVKLVPSADAQSVRNAIDLTDKTSQEIVHSKQTSILAGTEQVGGGKDIISILLKANTSAAEEDRLTEAEVIAQVTRVTLVFAATDSTSSALSRIFYLLAQHPEAQRRLRDEIRAARGQDGDLDYTQFDGLQYLDAVIRETMRLYAPAPFMDRVARKDTVLPLSQPITGLDGAEFHEITIPKGSKLVIAIMRANRDPSIWGDDAEEWRPERWLASPPEKVANAHFPGVYSNMMTFGGGGRGCIGFKFSQLEMKVLMCDLLESLAFSLSDKDIMWNLGTLITPSVKSGVKPQLPLIVSKV
ncbi:cytochrome P450 [Athelia psychrophila]|uniref:Cytochrome P450 n=1 Tax=Athelia psychrophila TaxID=1759441 RepID=A0A166DQI5_9AGAM|nr:cytochrome P450 [Fibularhizoctonia sp. CBS 109695]